MKQLLNDLQNVDIDLWREIQGFRIHYELGGQELSLCDDRLLDHVQGACQRAIAARGWTWEITDLPNGLYIAEINQLAGGYMGDHYEANHEYLIAESTAGSPSGAILTAYIAARKACP